MRLALCLMAAVIATLHVAPGNAQESTGRAAVTGAGSTFAFPVIARWAAGYSRWKAGGGDFPVANSGLEDPPSGASFDYEPSGSLAGTMRVREGAVDFAASDVPLRTEELSKINLAQFPIVIGGVAIVYNVGGVGSGQLKLTGEVLADIFSGKILKWNDQAIAAINSGVSLPDLQISVVRRLDGSGTTFNFTSYLSAVSSAWKENVGADLLVKWPVGKPVRGNESLALAVKSTLGAIGYVDFGQALRNKLAVASIKNRSGEYVLPSQVSFQAAASGTAWSSINNFDRLLIDADGADAYPIVLTVFAQMRKGKQPAGSNAALSFFKWSLERGQKEASGLGYVPIPDSVVGEIKKYWASSFGYSS